MKTMSLFAGLLMAGSVALAADLTVNKPYEGTVENAATLSIAPSPTTVATDTIVVLSAKVLFTIPSESPAYDEAVKAEKLALAVDTDGAILIADASQNSDAGGWLKTAVTTDEETPITVTAEGKVQGGKLVFSVKVGSATYSVTSPASDAQLATLETMGEGAVSELSLALVDTAVLPSGETSVSSDLVNAYMAWVTNVLQGNMPGDALPNGVDAADAFAMNVAGQPALQIVAVDPIGRTVTLQGLNILRSGENSETNVVQLDQINGKIYLAYSDKLDGEVEVSAVSNEDIELKNDGTVVVTLPEDARFVKAAISLEAPQETL